MPRPAAAPTYHPGGERLVDYASGALPEPLALLVATHLALCPRCRRATAELEAVGGALLEGLAPAPLAADRRPRALARLENPAATP
jgi:putative transcriptional regulator